MKQGKWIVNGLLVLPDRVVRGGVRIERQTIADVVEGEAPESAIDRQAYEVIDADGAYVLPGLIDLHCDAIEKEVQPRPNTLVPIDFALFELEKKLAACGITTMYQSLSLGVGLSLRGDDVMLRLLEQIDSYRQGRTMIRHKLHLRYELVHLKGIALAEELVHSGKVDYLSFMNHGPGQGQYRRPGSFEAYVMKNQGVGREEVEQIAARARQVQAEIDWPRVRRLAQTAGARGIRIASHDDDSAALIDQAVDYGVAVSEFPLNLETARYAAERGLAVCVGAPNVVRGGSHDKNLRAMDAIDAGAAHVLCSDYLPSTLLAAVFAVADAVAGGDAGLPRAAAMATLQPARAMGIDARFGSIAPGKAADLLLVRRRDGYPHVLRTLVNGTAVYAADYYEPDA